MPEELTWTRITTSKQGPLFFNAGKTIEQGKTLYRKGDYKGALSYFEDVISHKCIWFYKDICGYITVCYKKLGHAQTAVDLYHYLTGDSDRTFRPPVWACIELGFAFCEVHDYENAKKYADIANARKSVTPKSKYDYKERVIRLYLEIRKGTNPPKDQTEENGIIPFERISDGEIPF